MHDANGSHRASSVLDNITPQLQCATIHNQNVMRYAWAWRTACSDVRGVYPVMMKWQRGVGIKLATKPTRSVHRVEGVGGGGGGSNKQLVPLLT